MSLARAFDANRLNDSYQLQADPYALHKARYLDRTEAPSLRRASGQWLIDHGMVWLDGKDILPGGRLPE